MVSRRQFVQRAVATGIGLGAISLRADKMHQGISEHEELLQGSVGMERDENYWSLIRAQYAVQTDFINLENGYFSPQPTRTIRFHQEKENYINAKNTWFMRKEQTDAIENARKSLATFFSVSPEELAMTRNTTESLNTVIAGYPWKAGDEVIIGNQDYGSMVTAFHQAEKRFGIKVLVAEIPLQPKNDEEIIDAYMSLVSTKTRVIHVTHLINLSGQVLPVAKLADAAHARNIEVMVDAAHSVAHIDFVLPDLHADYVAGSLHKWLCNPLGVGFLWMKKEHISNVWPLLADEDQPIDNIRKFEHQGTRPIQHILTIPKAIEFHQLIGSGLKQARLKFLMKSWTEKVSSMPKVKVNTPWNDDHRNSAIANVSVDGYTPSQLADHLFEKHNIFTVAIDHKFIKGVRITPHVYTTPSEIEKLVDAISAL